MTPTPERPSAAAPTRGTRWRRTLRRAGVPLLAAIVAGAGLVAVAAPRHHHDEHGGLRPAAFQHHRGGAGEAGAMLPMQGRGLERMLDRLEATDAQRTQIRAIVEAARSDLQAGREGGQALRAQMADLFAQPSIDAAAVEALRQQMLARHDQASQRMTQAMLEVGQVLTPVQRARIAEWRQARAERWASHPRAPEATGQ